MGKYTYLRGKLPAFAEEEPYQVLVDEKKQELIGTLEGDAANALRLASQFIEYEKKKKALYERYSSKTNDAEYEINLYRKALSQLLVDAFTDQGVKGEGIRLADGLVSLDDKPILTIKDKPAAIEWALANVPEMLTVSYKGLTKKQLDALAEWGAKRKLEISVTLDSNTLKALGRDNALQGKPTPPGMGLFLLTQAKVYGLSDNGDE